MWHAWCWSEDFSCRGAVVYDLSCIPALQTKVQFDNLTIWHQQGEPRNFNLNHRNWMICTCSHEVGMDTLHVVLQLSQCTDMQFITLPRIEEVAIFTSLILVRRPSMMLDIDHHLQGWYVPAWNWWSPSARRIYACLILVRRPCMWSGSHPCIESHETALYDTDACVANLVP